MRAKDWKPDPNREAGIVVVNTPKAIVRIHPGKMTDEERRVVLEKAAIEFMQRIEKARAERMKATDPCKV